MYYIKMFFEESARYNVEYLKVFTVGFTHCSKIHATEFEDLTSAIEAYDAFVKSDLYEGLKTIGLVNVSLEGN